MELLHWMIRGVVHPIFDRKRVVYGDFNNCELEFEKEIPLVGYYHYRTERITTNWWYYETTLTVTHNLK